MGHRAPVRPEVLYRPQQKGGLGLLDFQLHAFKIFTKWFLDITKIEGPSSHWAKASNLKFSRALGIAKAKNLTSLLKYLANHPKATGPHKAPTHYKRILCVLKENEWSVACSDQENHNPTANPKYLHRYNNTIIENTTLPKTEQTIARIDYLDHLDIPYSLSTQKFVWHITKHPLLLPKERTHVWRCVCRTYRTADRSHPNYGTCPICSKKGTLEHRLE